MENSFHWVLEVVFHEEESRPAIGWGRIWPDHTQLAPTEVEEVASRPGACVAAAASLLYSTSSLLIPYNAFALNGVS